MDKSCVTKLSNLSILCRLFIIITQFDGVVLVPHYFTRFSNGCEVPTRSKTRDNLTDPTDLGITDSYFGSNINYKQDHGINLK